MGNQVEDRMEEIRRDAELGATWPLRLLALVGGNLRTAAILDLTIDGNLWHTDLRLRPFAGRPELRELFRAARDADNALRSALVDLAWEQKVGADQ